MKYLITGGTGFLGKNLTQQLLKSAENQVIILTRSPKKSRSPQVIYEKWDGLSVPTSIKGVDVVINLAGAGIADARWTDSYKRELVDSRVNAAQACVEFIQKCEHKPQVFIAGSAVGYYGGYREEAVDENDSVGDDFMADICKQWEEASQGSGIRTVTIRTGVVLGKDGGPLAVMAQLYRLCIGGPIGSGRQGFPWIHLEDWIRAVTFLVEDESAEGPFNLAAPTQTDQGYFSAELANVLDRPNFFWTPKPVIQLALGERSIIAWGGQTVKPERLHNLGFKFQFDQIKPALQNLLK